MSTTVLPPPIETASLDNLRLIGGGSDEFVVEIVQMFREDTPPRFEELTACVAQGDAGRLAKAAHSLKGSASNFGAKHFRELAEQIELLGKGGDLSVVTPVIAALKTEYERVLAALDEAVKPA